MKLLNTLLLAVCLASSPIVIAQVLSSAGTERAHSKPIPSHVLAFSGSATIRGMDMPAAIELPVRCTPNGAIFINVLDSKTMQAHMVKVEDKQAQFIPLLKVSGLSSLSVIDFFPYQRGSVFLVSAVQEELVLRYPAGPQRESALKQMHVFIINLDAAGNVIKKVLLEPGWHYEHLGVLSSGSYVVSAKNVGTEQNVLLALDDEGKIKQIFDQVLSKRPVSGKKESFIAANFSIAGDHLIGWRADTSEPLADFDRDGNLRTLPIQMPSDSSIGAVISSDRDLIVQIQPALPIGVVHHEAGGSQYYEISFLDGSLVSKLIVDSKQVDDVFCKVSNTYISFASDREGFLTLFTAE